MSAARLLAALLLAAAAVAAAGQGAAPTPSPAVAGTAPPEVVLEWSATREKGVYGYLIYRSDRREGPFRRLNRDIVRAGPEGGQGVGSYRWVDTDVEPGRTYYYYLDTLTMSGLKQRLSGVISRRVPP